jgi:hypothetical protein
MILEVIKNEIDFYEDIVMKKPISKDFKSHLIQGFVVKPTSPEKYKLYVLGEDPSHPVPLVDKLLEDWLKDNGY